MTSHPHQEPQHHELQHPQSLAHSYQPPNISGQAPVATAGQPVFDLSKFWQEEMANAERFDSDFKNHALPLARIKKVMKTDHEVKMISAEAPILFAKGCEIFITELTKRAWVHAEENKRRTLQRSDIATAISKTDMCDFLIDIVPREEAVKSNAVYDHQTTYAGNPTATAATYYPPQYAVDPTTYYSQLPQFTNDQVHQYQMQLQQFAQQQHQQHLPHQQDPSHQSQPPPQPQPPYQPQPQPQQQQPEADAESKEK